jgi:hypothetical protein
MTKLIEISSPKNLKKPIFFPFHRSYKCEGSGFFYDGVYGYYGATSYLWDFFSSKRNRILGWFGLCLEWRCDGTGKSRIRRQQYK